MRLFNGWESHIDETRTDLSVLNNFCLKKPKKQLVNSKFLISDLPITFWFLVFDHLPFFQLFELKFVSKRFHEIVNSDVNFKRILKLTNSMRKQVLWSDKTRLLILNRHLI